VTAGESKVHTEFAQAAVRIFAANDRLNQILIENLSSSVWRAVPPGKVRSIAAIFTHMHNVRAKWIRLTAPHLGVPPQLSRARCTPRQAGAALAKSAGRCEAMLAEAQRALEQRRRDQQRGDSVPKSRGKQQIVETEGRAMATQPPSLSRTALKP
jgi:uncharacterized damage-inducible protein DinB